MAYFENFDRVLYDFSIHTDTTPIIEVVPDLTTRVATWISSDDILKLCGTYIIKDRDTPEIVAHKIYGDVNLHWTIMYINNITDNSSWPMTEEVLKQFVKDKYGVNNVNTTHHYETVWGVAGDQSFLIEAYGLENVIELTNYDYESRLNESKRQIYYIQPVYLPEFIAKFQEQIIR